MLSSHLTVRTNPTESPPPLIGALLRGPWEIVRDRMLDGLHQRGFTDLVAAHLNVLLYPGPDDARPSELAARTRMTKQALNYLLGQMEALGYIRRARDSADQRSKRVHLTPRGFAAGAAMREIVMEIEAEWTQLLGPRRFAQLRDSLAKLSSTAPRGALRSTLAPAPDSHRRRPPT
jgi:DNA-binding MarR family transcriptional regulator